MYYPPDKNGMAVYAHKIHHHLLEVGWSVRVIVRRRPGRRGSRYIQEVNVPSVILGEWADGELGQDFRTYSLKFSKGVYELLTPGEQIIHYLACWDDHILVYSALARGLNGKAKILLTIGGGGQRPPGELSSFRAKVLNKIDVITVFSHNIQANLIEAGVSNNKVVFIPPSVDLDKFPFREDRKHKVLRIIYVGRIDRMKGIFDILKVAKFLRHEPLEFYLIGEGPDKGLVKKKIYTNKCTNISLLPSVNHEDVPRILRDADIFLHPTYDDEFPSSLLEALASGLPCISTPVGEIPEIIKNDINGFLVSPGNIKGISNAILALQDFQKRTAFSRAARRIAEKYSDDIIIPKLLRIYSRLNFL